MRIMKTIKLKCSNCGLEFEKELKEYKRQIKNGRHKFYCTLSCSKKTEENKTILEKALEINPKKFIGGENKILSEEGKILRAMKEFTRRIRRRKKFEYEINPNDLFKIWIEQEGKCPYTKVSLVLPFNENYDLVSKNYKASLDRKNSRKPYSIDNVQFVSISVNFLKNDMSDNEIIEFFELLKK